MSKSFEFIFTNGENLTLKVLLLLIIAALIAVIVAFIKGTIPTPGTYKRLEKADEQKAAALELAKSALADSRVLHAGSVVRLEFLEREISAKNTEINDCRAKVTRLETELEVLRREYIWKQPNPNGGSP